VVGRPTFSPWSGRIRLAFATLLAVTGVARGTGVIDDKNVWLHISATGPLLGTRPGPNPWRYAFETPQRFADNVHKHAQGAWRFGVGRMLTPEWSVWGGYVFTWTDTPYTRTPYAEHRPYQQLSWIHRGGRVQYSGRLRVEERFLDTGHDMGLRVRQQFRVSVPAREIKPLAWVFSEEYFLNVIATDYGARRGLDQNRAFAGAAWQWSEILRSEVGYLHQYLQRNGQPNRVNHALVIHLALTFP
jgi:hypothetical protein